MIRNFNFRNFRNFKTFNTILTKNYSSLENEIFRNVITREKFFENNKQNLLDTKIGVLGYGNQARSQALNLRDNNYHVSIGSRNGNSYDLASQDGFIENETLLSIEDLVEKNDIIMCLLSDVGMIQQWPKIKPHLKKGKTLYVSHGFNIVYTDVNNLDIPSNIDIVMVAPKGAGISVREKFLKKQGINVSYGVFQDYSGKALENCLELAFGIGCGHAFKTTFKNEVYSDLLGERCVLMGLIQGAFSAQYKVLRENGHSPEEAYNETVEEALVSLYPLIDRNGMDWLYKNCSTTAQRGALDWAPVFEKALKPVIQNCYNSIVLGNETNRVLQSLENKNYKNELNEELGDMSNTELWKVSKIIKNL